MSKFCSNFIDLIFNHVFTENKKIEIRLFKSAPRKISWYQFSELYKKINLTALASFRKQFVSNDPNRDQNHSSGSSSNVKLHALHSEDKICILFS